MTISMLPNSSFRRDTMMNVSEMQHNIPMMSAVLVDVKNQTVTIVGKESKLTPTEFRLLGRLLERPGKPISNDELLAAVWGSGYDYPELLRINIARLRRKIEPDPANPRYVKNCRGRGYYFDDQVFS